MPEKAIYKSPKLLLFDVISSRNILNSLSIEATLEDWIDTGDVDFGKKTDGTYIDWTNNNF